MDTEINAFLAGWQADGAWTSKRLRRAGLLSRAWVCWHTALNCYSRMYRLFPDTRPEVEERQIELLRRAEPWRKLEMVRQMNAAVRTLLLSGLRSRHPEEGPETLERRLADLLLGPELACQVYGPLEEPGDAG